MLSILIKLILNHLREYLHNNNHAYNTIINFFNNCKIRVPVERKPIGDIISVKSHYQHFKVNMYLSNYLNYSSDSNDTGIS